MINETENLLPEGGDAKDEWQDFWKLRISPQNEKNPNFI